MKRPYKITTHHLLAFSYVAYFICIAVGIGLSIFFPVQLHILFANYLAGICFIAGPAVIVWAQHSSYIFERGKRDKGEVSFYTGPYKFLRNPTQFGLFLLILGYVFVLQSLTLFAAVLISYIIGNHFYKKQELLLEQKYGKRYRAYKEEVKKIF